MIKAIIIDDEEDGREGLRISLSKYCPEVQLVRICSSPDEGIKAINETNPNLVFLDVQMPGMSGFDVLHAVPKAVFEVIFVSAYDQYAIKAIKFSALDYLLKPIDMDELVHAIKKVRERLSMQKTTFGFQSVLSNIQQQSGKIQRLAVPTWEGIDFFNTEEIIFCQAEGTYTTIYLTDKTKTLISKNLKEFENMLIESGFCRVHNSHLINIVHVLKYIKGEGGYVIMTNGHKVDISRRKKEEFIKLLSKI